MSDCPVCGGSGPVVFQAVDRNRGVSDVPFAYRRCERCATLWLEDIPEDLGAYYPDQYNPRLTRAYLAGLADHERYRLPFVTRHVPTGRLIDIGAGGGAFALLATDAGFDVTTIDVDAAACAHLSELLGIEAIAADDAATALEGLEPADAITMWHSLEHVPDPVRLVRTAAGRLRPGGVLVIAVPNPESLGARVLGPRWTHLDAPRHLRLIPADALVGVARDAGLEQLELTADDRGARLLNGMAWHYTLHRPGGPALADKAAVLGGQTIAAVASPVERTGFRGSAYTAVFTRPA